MSKTAFTICIALCVLTGCEHTHRIAEFEISPHLREQVQTFTFDPDVRVHVNAPAAQWFDPHKPVRLVIFALPNGNTIEQTVGRQMAKGLDWHYDIQHIGAQVRQLRRIDADTNIVVAYVEAAGRSWPLWCRTHEDAGSHAVRLVEYLRDMLTPHTRAGVNIELASHSGGGSLVFAVIDALDVIPDWIHRILFIDSNYGYRERHATKLMTWLWVSEAHHLCVIAYDDRRIEIDGKRIISPTGGTYRRTREMIGRFKPAFGLTEQRLGQVVTHRDENGAGVFLVVENPEDKILHTVLVERQGLICGLTFGANGERQPSTFFGPRTYERWIQPD